jgi:hypothetical protein
MDVPTHLLQPVVALVVWSFVMWAWMYATRIPASLRMKIKYDSDLPNGTQTNLLPANVRWKADNYNHLMEQPTLFYALMLTLAFMGETSSAVTYAAWVYVALRIIHSLVQALGNNIMRRFYVYVLSNVALLFLTIKAVIAVF